MRLTTNIRDMVTKENWDFVTVVTGREGVGKSTLALHLAHDTDPEFSGEQIAFDLPQLLELVATMPPGRAIVFDEAVQGAYARNAMTSENKNLNTVLMIARAKNLHFIFCIPNFWDLDTYTRSHRARLWCDVKRRGHVQIREASPNVWRRDIYWKPILNLDFGPFKGHAWDTYVERKMAYITGGVNEAQGKPRHAGEVAANQDEDEALVESVLARAELRPKGKASPSLIMDEFNIPERRARRVARKANLRADGRTVFPMGDSTSSPKEA